MASQFKVSTTGTLSPVPLNDLGGRSFTHPTVAYDLVQEYTPTEIAASADLQAAITAGHLTVLDENGIAVTTSLNNFPGPGLSSDLPVVQARRTTSVAITTGFVDVALDATDLQNNAPIVARIAEKIYAYQTGLYQGTFHTSVDADATEETITMRAMKNGATVIPGSTRTISEDDEVNDIGNVFFVELTAGDYITFQVMAGSVGNTLMPESTYTLCRARGVKGDTGAAGATGAGSNIIVKDEGVTVSGGPHSAINFVGAGVSVADAGAGQATVTIPKSSVHYAERTTSLTTTAVQPGTNYLTTTTPSLEAGDYIVSWVTEHSFGDNTGDCFELRVQVDNAQNITNPAGTGWTREEPQDPGIDQRYPRSGFRRVTLTAGTHFIDVDFARSGTAGVVATLYYAAIEVRRA